MCGISGILTDRTENIVPFLNASIEKIKHRGPDQQDTWFHESIGLGHTRLSILDLSPAGAQPMHSASGRYVMAFNGEIYNHLALRRQYLSNHNFRGHSDSETILELFERIGVSMFAEMVGMWALLIWDKQERQLYLSRDRFGQKPLFVRRLNDDWIFASEMRVLMAEGETMQPNYTALVEYLATSNYGHLGTQTFFRDIHHFPEASWCQLSLKDTVLKPVRFWQLPSIPEKERIPLGKKPLKHIRDLLIESVLSQTLSDVPIGITLSGGIDSSAVAGILAAHYDQPLQVFTATSPGHQWDEGGYVDQVMKYWNKSNWTLNVADLSRFDFHTNLQHILFHQEEPFGDPSILAHAELMRMAAEKNIKVILSGQGSDELFLGYDHALMSVLWQQVLQGDWQAVKNNIDKIGWSKTQVVRLFLCGFFPELEKKLRKRSRVSRREFLPEEWVMKVDEAAIKMYRQRSVDEVRVESIHGIHIPHLLHYDDRNAMAYGVEGRTPFLDHRLWDYIATIRTSDFLREGKRKSILRMACAEFIPPGILQRFDKIGFYTPLDSWLHAHIETVASGVHRFLSPVPVKVEEYLREYKAGKRSVAGGQLLWRLYLTHKWKEAFSAR